ncbi:toxin Cry1Ac domain D-VI-related protein [Enterococcus lactis]|uniref:toxin Cry1Ac domain D-VI-related protein n=1 Tax=Enterococcus lactis TaxID=357441 RepID=UPI0040413C57
MDELFKDTYHDELANGVDQAQIDAAREAVKGLADSDKKRELEQLVEKAQELLKKEILEDATRLVDDLFSTSHHDNLADGVDQTRIDAAKVAVAALPESAEKTALQELIKKAQDLLNQKNELEAAVKALFKDDQFNALAEGVNESKIREVKKAVDKLAEGNEKAYLQGLIAQALELLADGQKETAITAVTPYTIGTDEWLTGSFQGQKVKKIGIIVNGKVKSIVLIPSDYLKAGNFRYYVGTNLITSPTDKVQVVLYDADYNELVRTQVPLKTSEVATEITKVDSYIVGQSEWVTGTCTGNKASQIGLEVNGVMQAIVPSDDLKNGTFKYYAGTELTEADQVQVVLFDSQYQEVARKAVPVEGIKTDITKVDPYIVGQSEWITGECTGTRAANIGVSVNGVMRAIVPSEDLKNGTFKYYIGKCSELVQSKIDGIR